MHQVKLEAIRLKEVLLREDLGLLHDVLRGGSAIKETDG